MSKLSQAVKLARFNSRKRRGDAKRTYESLDHKYSYSFVRGVLSGYRSNEEILSKGYRIVYRRMPNNVVV